MLNWRLPRLTLIADTPTIGAALVLTQVTRALAGAQRAGMKLAIPPMPMMIVERDGGAGDPRSDDRDRLARLKALRTLLSANGHRLVVSGRPDLAAAVGADGVHLPERGLAISAVRHAFPTLAVGRSCHDAIGIRRANAEAADWIWLSPLFSPTSKPLGGSPLGLQSFQALVSSATMPVVALGGLNPDRIGPALAAGAGGVAVLGAVFKSPDPGASVAALSAMLMG